MQGVKGLIIMIQVSVCIPVYNMQQYLMNCINSVIAAAQGAGDTYEVIVVDDGSDIDCDDIIKLYKHVIPLTYIKHQSNKGLLEARRTAVTAARGQYVLMLDCDDLLLPGTLGRLFYAAVVNHSDVVQGAGALRTQDTTVDSMRRLANTRFVASKPEYTVYTDDVILQNFLTKKFPTTYMCNKIIKRSVYLKALNDIPEAYVVLNEDLLQFFYIYTYCHKFSALPNLVVLRTLDTGLTNLTSSISLDRFKQLCSAGKAYELMESHIGKYDKWLQHKRNSSFKNLQMICDKKLQDKDKIAGKEILLKSFGKIKTDSE